MFPAIYLLLYMVVLYNYHIFLLFIHLYVYFFRIFIFFCYVFFRCQERSSKKISTQTAMSSMGVPFVTEVIVKAIDAALQHTLEGLNISTITDPQRHKILETVYSLLPASDDIARVAAVRRV